MLLFHTLANIITIIPLIFLHIYDFFLFVIFLFIFISVILLVGFEFGKLIKNRVLYISSIYHILYQNTPFIQTVIFNNFPFKKFAFNKTHAHI